MQNRWIFGRENCTEGVLKQLIDSVFGSHSQKMSFLLCIFSLCSVKNYYWNCRGLTDKNLFDFLFTVRIRIRAIFNTYNNLKNYLGTSYFYSSMFHDVSNCYWNIASCNSYPLSIHLSFFIEFFPSSIPQIQNQIPH